MTFVLVESNTTGSGREFCVAAARLGLRPVVLAADPARYPYLRADGVDHRVVDTLDEAAVHDACVELAAVGVTSSSEYYIATAATVAARLGRPAADAAAVARCRHKDRQRALLAAAGVPVPRARPVTSVAEAVEAARDLGPPVVVKPSTGSGSVGVRLCAGVGEVAEAAGALLAAGVNERGLPVPALALVEEYVPGQEFSVETFDKQVIGITRKYLGPPPHFVEVGHDFPARVAERDDLAATTCAALAALGLGWGAAHTELRLGPSGPVVIEVNPRLAGGMIPALVREATGVDLVEGCVRLAAGLPVSLDPTMADAAAIRFVVATGDRLPPPSSFRDRIGHVIATAPTTEEAAARADAALLTVSTGQS